MYTFNTVSLTDLSLLLGHLSVSQHDPVSLNTDPLGTQGQPSSWYSLQTAPGVLPASLVPDANWPASLPKPKIPQDGVFLLYNSS